MFPHLVDPAPPPVDDSTREAVKAAGRRRLQRLRRLRVATICAAATLGVAGIAGIVTERRRGDARVATIAGARQRLTGVEWRLHHLLASGADQDLPSERYTVVRFDGDGHFSGTACNHFYGEVEVRGSFLHFSEQVSTAMGCVGVDGVVEGHIGRLFGTKASWSLVDGALRLEGSDIVARFVERDTVFPTRDLHVLALGDSKDGQFQFGYQHNDGATMLRWEGRRSPGHPWGSGGLAVQPGGVDVMSARVGNRVFLWGYLPPTAARAEYRSGDLAATALEVAPLPGGGWAYWGYVPSTGGQVVALDGGGGEVGRSRPAPGE